MTYRKGQAIKFKEIVLEIEKTIKPTSPDGWVIFKPYKVRVWWVNEQRVKD